MLPLHLRLAYIQNRIQNIICKCSFPKNNTILIMKFWQIYTVSVQV